MPTARAAMRKKKAGDKPARGNAFDHCSANIMRSPKYP